jgi:hypothetical protein
LSVLWQFHDAAKPERAAQRVPEALAYRATDQLVKSEIRQMTRPMTIVVYVLALIFVVIGVDVLFFRDRFWERLLVNIGIVLVFGAFYLRFLKHP